MKPFHLLLYIAASLPIGCNSHFEIEGLQAEEKLVVYCMPTAGYDTTVIQLSKTVPLNSAGLPPEGIPDADIEFTVNGESQKVCWLESGTGSMVPDKSYYVVKKLSKGDRIDIAASSGRLPTVRSSSVVPDGFRLHKVVLAESSTDAGYDRQIRITFSDDPQTEDYYGVRVMKKAHYTYTYFDWAEDRWIEDTRTGVYLPLVDVSGEPLLNNKIGLDATLDFDYNYYQDLYIWNDNMISGKEYTLKINVELEYNDEEDNFSSTYNYKVCLYRLSPELYKFLKSLNDISNNELGQNGLAPIRSHYSNITDGFGFLGAASLYETPWLDNPDSDETEVWTPAG